MIERGKDLQYDTALDSQRFSALLAQSNSSDFVQKLEEQKEYIRLQIKTDIGERLDRSESKFSYKIKGNKLFGQGADEPFENVIERGISDRFNFGEIQDRPRENAELVGFKTIQSIMADPLIPDGTTILYVSPPGEGNTNYKKNFFDVHEKLDGEVHTTRYLSNLTNHEYRQKVMSLNPNYSGMIPENPTDVDFLSSPFVIPAHLNFSGEESLAKYILKEKIGMPEEELDQIWMDIAPVWTSYINTLAQNPEDLYSLDMTQRAIFNAVVEAKKQEYVPSFGLSRMEIIYLGRKPTTIGGGGCGPGGACSVSEFGQEKDDYGPRTFNCPACGESNLRPHNQLITNCQKCSSDKVLPKTRNS